MRKRPVDLNVDGYLAFDLDAPDSEFVNGSGSMKPGVNVGMVRREGWDNVLVDVSAAAIEAFQHLINIGCRRIAYLRPATQGQPKDSLYRTFRNLKSTPGITTDEIQTSGLDRKKAMEAVKDYTQKWGAPEGIVCFNDGLAIAAKRALSELGSAPRTTLRSLARAALKKRNTLGRRSRRSSTRSRIFAERRGSFWSTGWNGPPMSPKRWSSKPSSWLANLQPASAEKDKFLMIR
jgi:hypothetical protein